MNAFTLVTVAGIGLLFCLFWVEAKKRHLRSKTWDDILMALAPVRTEWLVLIALESREPLSCQRAVLSEDLWEELGGWRGMRSMLANAQRLHALAVHACVWNRQETEDVADRIRAEGQKLRSAVITATWGRLCRRPAVQGTSELQRAANAYFNMTESLLDLYEGRPSREYLRLRGALRPYIAGY